MFKLGETKDYSDFWWVGHSSCDRRGDVEKLLISRRADISVIGGVVDETLSYEYDEFALILLDDQYYLLQTSGCSCPSPSETWGVDIGPATLQEIRNFITGGHYEGYTLPKKREADFIALIDAELNRVN